MKRGLGTQLRHLLELLDGAVEQSYLDAGLDYRPRFTPVMRALIEREPMTIGEIAASAGITQPAATQTVGLMVKQGLLSACVGEHDGRQKMVRLSDAGRAMAPRIRHCWQATAAAADSLDAQLPYSLSQALDDAISALEQRSFGERIRAAEGGPDDQA
ncbi:MarR family winged helix-turn-helix transcriptional regulator [Massilia oculi]|jgi:DNA-binding MarR family transcriptional regulator|uniref:MarR family transcriptional regulator n=1 Tax=Massilia oculi TaxID=945844 RepID=A0A2S2DH39_9BURK|nr:MarR family transcriptional regulator [Massilia oculi]AWL04657.1 MarR family transcriptional regulator [Massilia oculi]